jgi:hypothetical protein
MEIRKVQGNVLTGQMLVGAAEPPLPVAEGVVNGVCPRQADRFFVGSRMFFL